MEMSLTTEVLVWGFGIAVLMGAIVNKTNFCTMGAVSDWVNMGDTGRLRAWVLAMATALLGVMVLEATSQASVNPPTLPPYRSADFAWIRYLVGGVMFGIGMTLASGCGNKCMVRIGGGNLKSVIVLLIAGFFAYLMTRTSFYEVLFHPWVSGTSISLAQYGIAGQDIGSILGGLISPADISTFQVVSAGVVGVLLLAWAFKSAEFRTSFDNVLGGLAVGLAVLFAWLITAGPLGQEWIAEVEWLDQRPINVAAQSLTFINPMADLINFLKDPKTLFISFGLVALIGVAVGSFVWSILSRSFRFEWFVNFKDFITHAIGAVLMGIGGVLAMGCTIGQAVTGVSTLAIGSILTFGSIVLGSALTMKIQYYKLLYENDATFAKALVTALVDFRLLPKGMRKLEAL